MCARQSGPRSHRQIFSPLSYRQERNRAGVVTETRQKAAATSDRVPAGARGDVPSVFPKAGTRYAAHAPLTSRRGDYATVVDRHLGGTCRFRNGNRPAARLRRPSSSHQPFIFLDMEQHCLRSVAEQDNESSSLLVTQSFEKPAEPPRGITGCHYFVERELFHRLSPCGREPRTRTA
jgi:hypothetical protein